MPPGIYILTPDHPDAEAILDGIIHLHASCIVNDHTLATFIPPLSYDRMHQRWRGFLDETASNRRIILVHLSSAKEMDQGVGKLIIPFDRTSWPEVLPGEVISGTVSLAMPGWETGPFRGLVQNVFVSSLFRRKGIAGAMLAELERQALGHDTWNLMLDTIEGTPAERLYEKLGWERLGIVRDYGISPEDGRLLNEVFFWKDLRPSRGEMPTLQ